MAATASLASTFSDTEIGSPMARSSATNAARVRSPGGWPATSPARRADPGKDCAPRDRAVPGDTPGPPWPRPRWTGTPGGQLGRRLLDVRLVLEQHVQRVSGQLRGDLVGT